MRVGICSVGTEIVVGDVTDTNAGWLATRLVEMGVEVPFHLAVGDDPAELVDALRWLVDRCDAVVVGGGLGPTPDDLTRPAIAEVAGVDLERRDDLVATIEARFARFGRTMGPSNLQQADVPVGATAFDPVGTAPGFVVEVARDGRDPCPVYAVPGVPSELQHMVDRDVLPGLLRRTGRSASITRVIHVTGMGESTIAEAIEDLTDEAAGRDDVRIAFLAGPAEVSVKVTGVGPAPAEARDATTTLVERIVERLGRAVAGVDDQSLEQAVARLLRLGELTVATAESCTAGLVASRLSAVPGASDLLRGGLVAYATDVKDEVLGVDRAVLDEHGPVAEATAEAMARRARELFGADIGLGVTCVAGPSTQGGQDVGTTIIAVAGADGEVRSRRVQIPGDRPTVQSRAATATLELLRRHLLELGLDTVETRSR